MANNHPRQRIAPVNPALVSSVRLRDPRLMRQTAPAMHTALPPHPQQIPQPAFNGAPQRMHNNFPNNNTNNRSRMPPQRFQSAATAPPYHQNNNNMLPIPNENVMKEVKEDMNRRDGKSSRSSSKYASKSTSNSKTSPSSSSSKSPSHKTSPRSSSSSKSSSRSKSSSASGSKSSSSTSKSKDRADDHSSPRKCLSLYKYLNLFKLFIYFIAMYK